MTAEYEDCTASSGTEENGGSMYGHWQRQVHRTAVQTDVISGCDCRRFHCTDVIRNVQQ